MTINEYNTSLLPCQERAGRLRERSSYNNTHDNIYKSLMGVPDYTNCSSPFSSPFS